MQDEGATTAHTLSGASPAHHIHARTQDRRVARAASVLRAQPLSPAPRQRRGGLHGQTERLSAHAGSTQIAGSSQQSGGVTWPPVVAGTQAEVRERGGEGRRLTCACRALRTSRQLPLRRRSPWGPSRCRAGGAREYEPDRPGFLDRECDQEGRRVPPPDGRDRAAHHVLAVPQAEQAALPRSPDGCAVGWRWLRARSRRHRWRVEGDGGATSILGGGRPQSSARPLRRPRQDRSSTKPRQAGASEPMTRKMLDSQPCLI